MENAQHQSESRFVIIDLSDAKMLVAAIGGEITDRERLSSVIERLRAETGGDIQDIATGLKKLHLCHACVVEGQQRYCNVLDARKSGRRLHRLIARAR